MPDEFSIEGPVTAAAITSATKRKSKVNNDVRVCSDPECSTRLSRYNLAEKCFTHRPIKYPRVRGRSGG